MYPVENLESLNSSSKISLSTTSLLKPNEIAKLFHPKEEKNTSKENQSVIKKIHSKSKNHLEQTKLAKPQYSNSSLLSSNYTNSYVGRDYYYESCIKKSLVEDKYSLLESQANLGAKKDTGLEGTTYKEKGYTIFAKNTYQFNTVDSAKKNSRKSEEKKSNDCPLHSQIICSAHFQKSQSDYLYKITSADSLNPQSHYRNNHRNLIHKHQKLFSREDLLGVEKMFKKDEFGAKGDGFAEAELFKMGFYEEDIKWDTLKVPDRRELHPLLHERLCSFINPDIILCIDDHEFSCHKIVLQCYSAFFDQMNNIEGQTYVKLDKAITKEAFFVIYSWMLTIGQGGFQFLSRDNILNVLIACQLLKITDLEEQCLAFIDNEHAFSEENAFHLFMSASKLRHKAIMELMVPRIKAFFLHLVSSREYLDLSVDDLCAFLQSNYAVVHCEIEMFMSAVRWLMFKWEDRVSSLVSVMRCIRFGLMTPSQLVDIRKNPESPEFLKITQDKNVQKMIDDGLAYSVENSLSGTKADHVHRCNLLKLNVPEPRNFSKDTKNYKTYSEFLKFLQELQKSPRFMYLKNISGLKVVSNSEESLINLNNGYSEDSLYSGNDRDKLTPKRNTSESIIDIFQPDKKVCDVSKDLSTGHGLFREYVDNYGNKTYKPIEYICNSEPFQTIGADKFGNDYCLINKKFINEVVSPEKTKSFIIGDYKEHLNNREVIRNNEIKSFNSNETNRGTFIRGKISEEISSGTSIFAPHLVNKVKPKFSLRQNAAVIIQAFYRGYRVRKELLFEKKKKLIIEERLKKKGLDSNLIVSKHGVNKHTSIQFLKRSRSSESSLAPVNKINYDVPGSLYLPYHASILIFGGKNPGCKLTSLNNSCTVYRYLPDENIWETVCFLPKPRYHHSTTMLKGKIYIIGGSDPSESENSENVLYNENWIFDPLTRRFTATGKLLTPRKSFGLVTFHGYMFAIGGQDKNNGALSSVERYDLGQQKWEYITPLPEPLIYPAVCVYKNNIWVAGGLNNYMKPAVSSRVYYYDPFKNFWVKSVSLRFGRAFSTLLNFDDQLHIIGGAIVKHDELVSIDSIDVLDEKQGKWKIKANMSVPRHGHVMAVLGNQILMVGGSTTKYVKSLNQVDAWCIRTGTWNRPICALPVPVVGHSVITLPPSTHI